MRRVPLGLWGLAVISGVLQVLPYPIAGPVPLWRTHLCWVALVPLLWALVGKDGEGRPIGRAQGAALGYVSGFHLVHGQLLLDLSDDACVWGAGEAGRGGDCGAV